MARKGEFSIRIETRRGTLWVPAKIGHLKEFGSLHNTISSEPPFLAKKVGGIPFFGHSPTNNVIELLYYLSP